MTSAAAYFQSPSVASKSVPAVGGSEKLTGHARPLPKKAPQVDGAWSAQDLDLLLTMQVVRIII